MAMKYGNVRPQACRPADQFPGPRGVTHLQCHHAEQVQGVGLVGNKFQNLSVKRGRLTQPALLVMPDGQV